MLEITSELSLPEGELEAETSRSSGPGGQNVNKLETKVSLRFNVRESATLAETFSVEELEGLSERLGTRLTRAGILRVSSQKHRSQSANKEAARDRLAQILRDALVVPASRKATKIPRGAQRRRLQTKRQRSAAKKLRRRPSIDDA